MRNKNTAGRLGLEFGEIQRKKTKIGLELNLFYDLNCVQKELRISL